MAITPVGSVGAYAPSNGTTTTVVLPAGEQAGDLIVVMFAGKPSGTAGTSDSISATGYTMWPTPYLREEAGGTPDLALAILYKYAAGGAESDPVITVGTAFQGTGAGYGGAAIILRGVDQTSPSDATPLSNRLASIATTHTGPTITTSTAGAWVISAVLADDDNSTGWSMTTAQGFTAQMSGSSYVTTLGNDHALGVATLEVASPGSVTCPTWTQPVSEFAEGATWAIKPAAAPAADRPSARYLYRPAMQRASTW